MPRPNIESYQNPSIWKPSPRYLIFCRSWCAILPSTRQRAGLCGHLQAHLLAQKQSLICWLRIILSWSSCLLRLGETDSIGFSWRNNMLDRTGGMQIRFGPSPQVWEEAHFRSECSRVWVPIHSRTWSSLEQHEPIHGMDWRTSALSRWSFGGMAGRKGEGSPSQLLSWSAKCKDDPVLAIDIEKLCGMVSRRDPCQDAPNHAAARHHMDRAYSCRKIFGLQNHSVCSIQVRDHTSWSRRSCTFNCDCQAPWFL